MASCTRACARTGYIRNVIFTRDLLDNLLAETGKSRVVTEYLDRAGLTEPLEALGFHLVGYGCTTCIGNSGPLPEEVSAAIARARPRGRRGALGQPQLRGPHPARGAS